MSVVYTARNDIVDERVWCPVSGRDVDVERCLSCTWLRRAELGQAPRYIECLTPAAAALPLAGGVNAGAQAVRRTVLPVIVGLGGLLVWGLILVIVVPLGAILALVGWTADQVWDRS